MKKLATIGCGCAFLACGALHAAVPQLKGTPEPAGDMGLKVKTTTGSQMVQAVTPKSQKWGFRQGEKKWTETHYAVHDIWFAHERGAEWKDRRGNRILLAKPTAFCPALDKDHAQKEDILAAMGESAEAFKDPTDETLARWAGAFSGKDLGADAFASDEVPSLEAVRLVNLASDSRCAAFFKVASGTWYYAQFDLAQAAKPKERETLLRQFLKGVAVDKTTKPAGGGVVMEGRWMTMEVPGYRFKTDLSRSQGQAFIKNVGRLMAAMQAAYKRYVPPQKDLGVSTVRVFSTREGYNEYMRGATGEAGDRTIGLWSPSHEELLILDMGNSARNETLKTMRHEAFHQYLFYATGSGRHAMWFNEGHACFFENVSYDAKKNYVRIWDDPKDRRPAAIARDPERYARLAKEILYLSHEEFYEGTLQEVNDRYAAAWAVVYFLEKGAPSFKEFSDYTGVLPAYLAAMKDGKSAQEATRIAWEGVSQRNFVDDFVKFWNKRNAARRYEPKP